MEHEHWQACLKSMQPQQRVRLTRPLYLSAYEVTQSQYESVTKTRPSLFAAGGEQRTRVAGLDTAHHPVENVNWHDAVEFCAKLSRHEKLGAAATYRLPTEAEAEYACRAGTTTLFWTGDSDASLVTGG